MALNVVYIDDEVMLSEIFQEMISCENISVKTFSDADKAIEDIQQSPPDIIFLDYRLYRVTGDELAFKLPLEIPKILVTGDIHLKTEYNFIKTFQKPVNYPEIRSFLESIRAAGS